MKYILFFLCMIPVMVQSQKPHKISPALDSIFNIFFKYGEPGGAVLLAKDDRVFYKKGFGIADINTKEHITTQTLFNLGSISKTFVAYGILSLAQEGKLSLEDDLFKYFPDFEDAGIAGQIRLYHLLTHSSGLPDSRKVEEHREFYLTAKDEENFAPLKQTRRLEFAPGTKYKYSNPAFNGLALVIEKITGNNWQQYIQRLIFKNAKMKNSTITDGAHPQRDVSHGYILNTSNEFEELDYGEEPTFAAAGNGGVWSSVEELWLYEKAIQKNLFLKKEWIDLSRTVFPLADWKDTTASRLGLSWFITRDMNMEMIGHQGSQGGFVSDYVWLPEKKIFFVLLCNNQKPVLEIRTPVLELLEKVNWLD
ncbi:MAG: serine hydrolase domain-containing protein [Chitinophagaceae bacterium]